MVTPHPPTLLIIPQHNGDGSLKDTARNIQETGEFTVSLVPFALVERMNATSFAFDSETSEFAEAGVEAAPAHVIAPPRVAGAPMSFECRLASFILHPVAHPTCAVILGTVVAGDADPGIIGSDGAVDPHRLDIVSRMGADWYGRSSSPTNFTLTRPTGWAR